MGHNFIETKYNTMQENDYIERALIELKRKFGKDELVATLLRVIKEKDIELGRLKSEIDHLNNELNLDSKEIKKQAKIEVRKSELYQLQVCDNKKLIADIRSLKILNSRLITEKHELLLKLNKQHSENQ